MEQNGILKYKVQDHHATMARPATIAKKEWLSSFDTCKGIKCFENLPKTDYKV